MLELIKVRKTFDGKPVLKGVSMRAEEGKILTIIGPSGSGKSTILKLILGLVELDNGQIWFDGENVALFSLKEIYNMRKKIGLLFQKAALFDSMNVEENVAFSLRETETAYTKMEIEKKVDHALDLVGMSGANHMFPAELSGGQQKRIGLARAIIDNPTYLLFDEPTTGLDPVLSTNIEDLIVRISTELKTTAIVVTHQISTILRVSDEIYYLHEGCLMAPETPHTIMQSNEPIIYSFINGESHGSK